MKLRLLLGVGLVAVVLMALPAAASDTERDVSILKKGFSPSVLTAPVGTRIVWTNRDSDAHTVEETTRKKFRSAILPTGGKYAHTFMTPGSFHYSSPLDPGMTGMIVVIPAVSSVPTTP